jgi:hypothetical protein
MHMGIARGIGLLLILAVPAQAQNVVGVRAGLISCAEGSVYVGNEKLDLAKDYILPSLDEGKSLYTGWGWVEVQLGSGAVLRMGAGGKLWMEKADLADMQLRVERGSIMVEIFEKLKGNKISIHSEDTVIHFKDIGLYRLDCREKRLVVYGGKAEIRRAGKKATLKKDRAAILDDKLKANRFDGKEFDELHLWAARRSFVLYNANEDTRMYFKNWIHLNDGWMANPEYGVEMYSLIAFEEQAQQLQNAEKARLWKEWQEWRGYRSRTSGQPIESVPVVVPQPAGSAAPEK